ncbi:MAG TPA: hypothetical protein VIH68_00690 [Bacteroidota bacterium]
MTTSLTFCLLFLVGCSAERLISQAGSKYKYWYEISEPILSDRLQYGDDKIFIQFRIDGSFVNFRLQNITTQDLSILWDEVRLVVDGRDTPIKFSGSTKALAPEEEWKPTVVPLGSSVIDFLVPAENLQLIEEVWQEQDLFPTRDFGDEQLRSAILESIDKTISIVMPLGIGSQTERYAFEFTVTDIENIPWRRYIAPKRRFGGAEGGFSLKDGLLMGGLVVTFTAAAVYFLLVRTPTPEE